MNWCPLFIVLLVLPASAHSRPKKKLISAGLESRAMPGSQSNKSQRNFKQWCIFFFHFHARSLFRCNLFFSRMNLKKDCFFFRRFHEMFSLRGDLLEWADFFFLRFQELWDNVKIRRMKNRTNFFFLRIHDADSFSSKLRFFLRTDFLHFLWTELCFFDDDPLQRRSDFILFGTFVRRWTFISRFIFQLELMKRTLELRHLSKRWDFILVDRVRMVLFGVRWCL